MATFEVITAAQIGGGGGGGVQSVTAGDASITVGGTAADPTVKLPYLVYTAQVSQASALVDPTVTPLLNTIGNIVWARIDSGVYSGTLSGAFTANKTITGFGDWQGTATSWMPLSDQGGTVTGYYTIWWQSANVLQLYCVDPNFVATDMFTLIEGTKLPIKLEVYP